jgi:hypothetical protein
MWCLAICSCGSSLLVCEVEAQDALNLALHSCVVGLRCLDEHPRCCERTRYQPSCDVSIVVFLVLVSTAVLC